MKKYIIIIMCAFILFLQADQAHAGYIKINQGVYQKTKSIKKPVNDFIIEIKKPIQKPIKNKNPALCGRRVCASA